MPDSARITKLIAAAVAWALGTFVGGRIKSKPVAWFLSAAILLGLLAEAVAAQPAFFRTEDSVDALYRVLTSSSQIDAAYVSFEDGYHRVVTRVDEDRKRSYRQIPAQANWHSSYIDDFSAGQDRSRHRTFFDTWGHVVGEYAVPTTLDIRVLAGYQEAKDSRSLIITQPTINPDTGFPIVSLRVPIVRNGKFIGCASTNVSPPTIPRLRTT